MTKKSSKKTPSCLQEKTVAEEEKPSSTSKTAANGTDEIFAGKKMEKSETGKTGKPDEVTTMTDKTKKKKTPSQLQKNTVAEEEKPSSTSKNAGNEIDEIFAGKKRKKSEMGKTGKPDEITKTTDKTKKKKKNMKRKTDGPDVGEFADQPSRPRKKTDDGLTIYTEEELGISNADAGNTLLCPFDCSCCF